MTATLSVARLRLHNFAKEIGFHNVRSNNLVATKKLAADSWGTLCRMSFSYVLFVGSTVKLHAKPSGRYTNGVSLVRTIVSFR